MSEFKTRGYCVYKHTSPSGKVYIGITGRQPEDRWGYNGSKYKTQPFYNAIQKYGWDNIQHEILVDNLTEEEAKIKEIEYIALYDATNYNCGYNVSLGGDLSISKIVHQYTIFGEYINTFINTSVASSESGVTDNAIQNAASGRSMSAGGYIWCYDGNEPSMDKLHSLSDYEKLKYIDCKICQYSFDGELIETYDSIDVVRKKYKDSGRYIYLACIGKGCSSNGYVWRFEGDPFDKYKLTNTGYNMCKLKYYNIPIYRYNFDGTYEVFKDLYRLPDVDWSDYCHILEVLNGKAYAAKGYIYRFERDYELEENGFDYIKDTNKGNLRVEVDQYSLDGTFIKRYPSIVEAEKIHKIRNVSMCCTGSRHHSGGFVWRYAGDPFDKYSLEKRIFIRKLEKYDRPVYKYDYQTKELVDYYDSYYDIPDKTNILKCLNNEIRHCKGYIYSFISLEDNNDGNNNHEEINKCII